MKSAGRTVPTFALFGETADGVGERFVHVEPIERRSRVHDWRIRAHAHRDLHQLFLILRGRGRMEAGGLDQAFTGPAMLFIPAGEVHGFEFVSDCHGYVVTFAVPVLEELVARDRMAAALFDRVAMATLDPATPELGTLETFPRLIEQELVGDRPGRTGATLALLAYLLTVAARLASSAAEGRVAPPGPRVALVARFRRLVEGELRSGWSIADYARALGVTPGRLRQACVAVTGRAPIDLLHERLIIEAKRNLTYTDMRVAEVAYDLGFDDPAYFSRFFTRHVGLAPGRFRAGTD